MISVIMPAYNLENYIGKSIESVLQQTYPDFELIVINDGSQDNTAEVVAGYAQKDQRVKLINQENGGVSVARNTGLDAAKGEYISFLDGDDLWHEAFLEKMLNFIQNSSHTIEFAYAKTEECFDDGRRELIGGDRIVNGFFEDFLASNNELRLTFHISALMFKRELVEKHHIRFVSGLRLSEDTGFMIELLCVAKAYGLNEVLTYYMRRENSATGKKLWQPDFWSGHTKIYEAVEAFIMDKRPEAVPAMKKARGFVAYRFVLSCLKHGYVDEALQYRARWQNWLKNFADGDGRVKDRMKCRLILATGKHIIWLLGRV